MLLVVAAAAPWIAPHDPHAQSLAARLAPPSGAHPFGTDQLGRDIFSRVVHGSRITLLITALAAVCVAPAGLLVGLCAGYFGGLCDGVLMRATDVFMAFPRLLLALALAAALGPGIGNAVIAIAISAWPPYARQARAEVLSLRGRDFVVAARMAGASHPGVLWRHMLPLCATSAVVRLAMDLAGIILVAAGLGFLGLGAQPPTPEWGAMVANGRQFLTPYWWVSAMPGGAIFAVSLAFNLIGDGLRDALDPRAARGRA
ncbi:peptide/nickel transport system permease protein [Methylobacterium pseudosasicola]|uniref:Peptide/nickel transport system permease protein n=1 Tax=Methylobacterium pseudosasicola TaxID=582667 RepID=A0A1I4UMX3_9HYPH|nr:peptide/nickel transport system permease protein [Methylobacterium pseudosasicola]